VQPGLYPVFELSLIDFAEGESSLRLFDGIEIKGFARSLLREGEADQAYSPADLP